MKKPGRNQFLLLFDLQNPQHPIIPAQAGIQTEDFHTVSLAPRLRGGDGKKDFAERLSPQRGGFTLIEVMMVLFIIVMIASVGVVAVTGQRDKARQRTAFAYVKTLETAIDRYDGDMGRPPTNEQGLLALVQCPADVHNPDDWAGPYVKSTAISRDPWGSEYQYASPGRGDGRSFDIWSFGPDGIDGTDDDIGSWKGSLN